MEQELNIAAILKDKPKKTKLWTPIIGDCELTEISTDGMHQQHIIVHNEVNDKAFSVSFTDKGKLYSNGECLLFPSKKMRDWSKFAWKIGDILTYGNSTVVFKRWLNDSYTKFCGVHEIYQSQNNKRYIESESEYHTNDYEREFDNNKIKAYLQGIEYKTGGKLNLETLEIEKPESQFKDGDILTLDENGAFAKIILILKELSDNIYVYSTHVFYNIANQSVVLNNILADKRNLRFATDSEKQQLFDALAKEGKCWNAKTKQIEGLPKRKREIWNHPKKCEFKAFDKVLVRDTSREKWSINLFSHFNEDEEEDGYPYVCAFDVWKFCIPYNEKTEHLLDTTDDWKDGN